jgi:hypothetical protein
MRPAITVGVVEFAVVALYVLIFTFLWRTAAAALADQPIGRAMAAVYS